MRAADTGGSVLLTVQSYYREVHPGPEQTFGHLGRSSSSAPAVAGDLF